MHRGHHMTGPINPDIGRQYWSCESETSKVEIEPIGNKLDNFLSGKGRKS